MVITLGYVFVMVKVKERKNPHSRNHPKDSLFVLVNCSGFSSD